MSYYLITMYWSICSGLLLLPVWLLYRWVEGVMEGSYRDGQLKAAIVAAALGWPFSLGMVLAQIVG